MGLGDSVKRLASLWFIAPSAALICLLSAPLLALLWRAGLSDFFVHITNATALNALSLSLLTSSASAIVAVITGTPLAYALARWKFRGKTWLELLIDLPVVLPPSVAGLALLIAFGRRGVFGDALSAMSLSLPFTTAAVVIAQTFVSAPLYVRAARIGFAQVDRQLEEIAHTEGATRWQLFRYVMIPLSVKPMLSGLVLCWTRALGEFGATILFAGNLEGRTQTMPLAIYIGFESDLNVALALSALLLGVSIILLAILRRLEDGSEH